MKELKFSEEGREAIKQGANELAKAVKATLGPKGRNVVIERQMNLPQITKDGVTVARNIEFSEHFKNTGAMIVKEAAENTNNAAGDGTTTAIVLTEAIINAGYKYLTAGANPVELKEGIDMAVKQVIRLLKEQSIQVDESIEKIRQIATISANNDNEVGHLIAGAIEKVTKNGVITVEEAQGTETEIDVVEGMEFDRGFFSPYFITNPTKMEAELEDSYIFITDKKITKSADMVKLLETSSKEGKPLLIICDELEGQALQTAVMNKVKNGVQVAVVKAPGFATKKLENLHDIGAVSGATVITDEFGHEIKDLNVLEAFGHAEKITVKRDSTTIVNGSGDKEMINERVEQIKALLERAESGYDKEKLQERLAKITGGIAVIYVGAASEVEMSEKKDRVDDALNATRSAIEEGIIPGGGVAFIKALKKLNLSSKKHDVQLGIDIIKHAITQPLNFIAENAGKNGEVIANRVLSSKKGYGYNAKEDEMVNMIDAGIIDPTKVSRYALENAASVAGMFLTTECVISIEPEPMQMQATPGMD